MSRFSTESVIAAAGGVQRVAKSIGISQQAVYQWFEKGIPLKRIQAISQLSGIAIEHLLPELFAAGDSTTCCPYCEKEVRINK